METLNCFRSGYKGGAGLENPKMTFKNVDNKPAEPDSVLQGCICTRPKAYVICDLCGYLAKGRIRKICNSHKNVLFISDYDRCPICKSWAFMMSELKTINKRSFRN